MKRLKIRTLKFIAAFMAVIMLFDVVFPTAMYALTSGPKSPEFMSFTPVATTNMVDLATGDFNYNIPVVEIPGAEGGGYALSLAYNSGINSEQEASWVGMGWNLNPGAIDRNMRGLPDDYSGQTVKVYNKNRPNWSVSFSPDLGVEAFSVNINASKALRYNNHNGYFGSTSFGIGAAGIGLNLNLDANGVTFSANVNPAEMISTAIDIGKKNNDKAKKKDKVVQGEKKSDDMLTKYGNFAKEQGKKGMDKLKSLANVNAVGGNYGLFTFSDACRATTFKKYSGFNINIGAAIIVTPFQPPIGLSAGMQGNLNMQSANYLDEANGYGYFNNPTGGNPMMDYYVEKANEYSKRDVFIGMPFANSDIFAVSGEGMSGGFRAFKSQVGNYVPEKFGDGKSLIKILNFGLDFSVGLNLGIGINIGVGQEKTQLSDWDSNHSFGDKLYFRFNNDLGGKIEYGANNNDLLSAGINLSNPLPGFKSVSLDEGALFNDAGLKDEDAGASSFIDYHTFGDITDASGSFTKDLNPATKSYINDKAALGIGDKNVAEFSIYNENGENYVYGLPILTRNETSLSFDINPSTDRVNNKYLAFRNTPLTSTGTDYDISNGNLHDKQYKTILGEICNKPYATTYLLTQITQPNYVDVNNDGPTDDDFGGWTKFSYNQKYGSANTSWYRYRSPYNGLLYKQNSISSIKDDVGTVNTGEKEIYYLNVIETKTHIAFFVTNKYKHNTTKYGAYNVGDGDDADRLDGLGASRLNDDGDPASNPATVQKDNNQQLEYLEKIVLYSKARPEKPIKIVRFGYDYSLVPNLPNNSNSSYSYASPTQNVQSKTGKLTLRRLWFEYEGTAPAKISPYEFNYEYKKSTSVQTGSDFFIEYDHLTDGIGSAQNPSYAPELLDPWGNLMPYGKERKSDDIPYIYQGNDPKIYEKKGCMLKNWRSKVLPTDNFDPAAWHLKSIKLPSGGEIHVQYEQKDYGYVQNRPSLAMASLIASNNSYNDPYFDINVDDLGCDPKNLTEVNALLEKIKNFYNTGTEATGFADKIYFKFLYDLIGSNPILDNPNSEYITGYANFNGATIVDDPCGGKSIRISLSHTNADAGGKTFTPRSAAYDFVVNQRQGILQNDRKKNLKDYDGIYGDLVNEIANQETSDLGSITKLALEAIPGFAADNGLRSIVFANYDKDDVCTSMSNELSFLKLPVLKAKRGGGVRVKRLLIYDNGIETGDAQVFGQSYHYVLDDGVTSSGVASNEPGTDRDENPLVQYVLRRKQTAFSKFTAGEDKEQTEGPCGESILPSASVCHSRVVVENIHSDKSASGFTVHEFYTTKDYPFDMIYGCKDRKNDKGEMEPICPDIKGKGFDQTRLNNDNIDFLPNIPMGLFSYATNKIWMSQGFRFIINSMNGLQKRVTAYGGKYTRTTVPLIAPNKDTDKGYLVTAQNFEYYEPGEKVRLLKHNTAGGYDEIMDTPGKQSEIAVEKKLISDDVFKLNIEVDISIGLMFPPPIFVTVCPSIGMQKTLIGTHANTKILRYPAILKSQTNYKDGVVSKTDYLAFDAATGKPIITKTYDGYYNRSDLKTTTNPNPGEIYQFAVPAHWIYPEMGAKSKVDASLKDGYTNQLSATTMSIATYGNAPASGWLTGDAIDRILDVKANTYERDWSTNWSDPVIKAQYNIQDKSVDQLNHIWRPKASYVYKVDKEQNDYVSSFAKPIYEGGVFSIPAKGMFDWANPDGKNSWIKVSEITKYAPGGTPLEELDVMKIPSSALYGAAYGYNLPTMVVNNAQHCEIFFNDMELKGLQGGSSYAHSGNQSIAYSSDLPLVSNIKSTTHLQRQGGLLKLWAAFDPPVNEPPALIVVLNAANLPLTKVATSGNWALYECAIDGAKFPAVDQLFSITLGAYSGTNSLYIDDVRFQPLDAQGQCFVYDKQTFKLLTRFDDQHFGAYYKYNNEGTLTHMMVETERGVKTVQETQYNIPKGLR